MSGRTVEHKPTSFTAIREDMMSARRARAIALGVFGVVVLVVVAATPAIAADREVIQNVGPDVAAHNGYFVWSDIALERPRRLVLFSEGERRVAPERPIFNSQPFGLGRDGRDRPVAVYHRCKTSPAGCDLYELDLGSRRERKLAALSKPRLSEYRIAVSNGRYLFARRNHFAGRRSVSRLFVTRPLRPVSDIVVSPWDRRHWSDPTSVTDLALRGRVAAAMFEGRVSVVHLTPRGPDRWCRITRMWGSAASVVITKLYVYWTHEYRGTAGVASRVMRRRIPSPRCVQRGPLETLRSSPQADLVSVTAMGGRVFYTRRFLQASGIEHTLFEMTDPLIRD
jgi:hypothetical protein